MEMIPTNNNAEKKEVTEEEMRVEQEKENYFHILAVDDCSFQRKILEALLKTFSHQVTSFDSARKALEYLGVVVNPDHNASASNPSSLTPQLERRKVNMIITDYCMPEMTGHQLLIQLKKSAWKDIPVIINSSEDVQERINECLKDGAEKFLLKPLKPSDIEALQPLLSKSSEHIHLSHAETNFSDMANNSDVSTEAPKSSAD